MQEPTHIITGALIQRATIRLRPRGFRLAVVAALAFLSHGFLDELATVTYHPPDADFRSLFWVSYHVTVLVTTVWFVKIWWKSATVGVLFAALPDFDWVVIHGQNILHLHFSFYQRPYLHELLHRIYHEVPPFTFVTAWLERLPNWRHEPWAVTPEIILIGLLALVWRFLKRIDPQAGGAEPVPARQVSEKAQARRASDWPGR